MRKQKTILVAKIAVGLAVPAVVWSYATGPDPGYSGGPREDTCVACHTGTALNGGGGNAQITSSAGTTYTPGQQQTLTLTITDSKARAYGFQMSARIDNGNTQAGNFAAGPQQIVICQNGALKGSNGCSSNFPIQYIEHSRPFTSNKITISWTPPSSAAGTITIYAAANAANGDGNDTGDHIYSTKLQLSPASASSAGPTIASGGVVAASAYNPNAGFAPGSWIEIYGNNLSSTTRGWTGSDFNGNNAPTSLDGVSVTVGGINAYISYVSPGQVDALIPDGIPLGAGVPVVLTNSQGQTSPYSIQTSSFAGALLAPPAAPFNVNGKQYVLAQVGQNVVGMPSQTVSPGSVITLYGFGFRRVTPATPPGVLAQGATSLTTKPVFMFGQTQADLQYYGLAPTFTGLYQFNIVVPNDSP